MPAAVYPFTRFVYPGGQKDRRAYARLPLRITNPHTRQTLVTLKHFRLLVDYRAKSLRLSW